MADRALAQALMLALATLMAWSLALRAAGLQASKRERLRLAPWAFFLLPLWILLVDVGRWTDPAISFGRIWFFVWWLLVFSYARSMAAIIDNHAWLSWSIVSISTVYAVGIVWGGSQIASNFSVDYVVNNYGYYTVGLYPFIRLIPMVWVRRSISLLAVALTVGSLKRGAIIVLVVMLFIELVFAWRAKSGSKVVVGVGAILVLVTLLADQSVLTPLWERLSPDSLSTGSGRSQLYPLLIEEFAARSVFDQFVGSGSESIDVLGLRSAHNDWLEMLLSYGAVGLALYVALVISLIKAFTSSSPEEDQKLRASELMALSYFILASFYSQSIFGYGTLFSMIMLGMVVGLRERGRHES